MPIVNLPQCRAISFSPLFFFFFSYYPLSPSLHIFQLEMKWVCYALSFFLSKRIIVVYKYYFGVQPDDVRFGYEKQRMKVDSVTKPEVKLGLGTGVR